MSTDIAAWLRNRLDEVEAVAKAASPSPWTTDEYTSSANPRGRWMDIHAANMDSVVDTESGNADPTYETARHIAMHDPASVLRQVAGARKLLELHVMNEHYFEATGRKNEQCITCDGERSEYFGYPCPTLQALAEMWGWTE